MKIIINQMTQELIEQLPQIAVGIVVFLVFYILSVVVKYLIVRLAKNGSKEHFYVYNLFAQLIKIGLLVLGVVTSLGTMGVNVSALVAGLGLTGFALGFALKDALSNFLSGILIMMYRPFKPRQEITVNKFTGVVKTIDLRYTTLTNEEEIILIPNSTMLTDPVTIHKNK